MGNAVGYDKALDDSVPEGKPGDVIVRAGHMRGDWTPYFSKTCPALLKRYHDERRTNLDEFFYSDYIEKLNTALKANPENRKQEPSLHHILCPCFGISPGELSAEEKKVMEERFRAEFIFINTKLRKERRLVEIEAQPGIGGKPQVALLTFPYLHFQEPTKKGHKPRRYTGADGMSLGRVGSGSGKLVIKQAPAPVSSMGSD
eukprot:comp12026_c0_seq1/m.6722 comp12026_c0_seq1/g.6722  ORF comp12026_c0_seq1/g.6722 comp12026_c0_seq1/m.6722 type:complete len:202 (-) comp12026_c0_seq1:24-629(-)